MFISDTAIRIPVLDSFGCTSTNSGHLQARLIEYEQFLTCRLHNFCYWIQCEVENT